MTRASYGWLVLIALYEIVRYEVVVAWRGFGCILRQLRRQPVGPKHATSELERAICDAVLLATCFYWKPVLCLQRSVCTVRLLRKYGDRCPAGDRLSALSILLTRLGRGRWPGRVWLCSVSATPSNTSYRITLKVENEMITALETTISKTKLNEPYKPVDGAKSSCVLHWDGRLDNRYDLLALLADLLRDDTSNSAIALAAYERWGTDGFVHLIGDWSVVIRDHANRATVLASDFAGVRPLYYSVQREDVFWSSRLQSVVDATGISELDEHYIGAFLLYGGCPNRTPYKGIYSVPAGHAVCVSSHGTKISRFWNLPIDDEVRYRNQHRYEEHLRALFREAVSVRLQTEAPVLAELSGGLDSSSVVSMANHLMRSSAVPAKSLTSVSYVWRNSLDEPFIREMESFCGIKGVHISTHDVPLISETHVGNAQPEILQPFRKSVALLSRRLGAKVLLTGQNGDLMMANLFDDSLQLAASLRRFRVARACKEALEWSKILRLPVYRLLWRALALRFPRH